MARTVRDAKLESRTARLALSVRTEPHWKSLDGGLALGYRRNKRGGAWLARRWDAEKAGYREAAIGKADDVQDADDQTVFSFSQAQTAAREWWRREERVAAGLEAVAAGPYTVEAALRDYFAARERKGSKGVYSDSRYADTRIVPDLGGVEIGKLTTARIRRWHEGLAAKPKLVRSRAGAETRRSVELDHDDPEAVRARRASANRILTILKAALNHAYHENHVGNDEAWRKAKPFREVDSAVVRYLTGPEAKRLVNACEPDFRQLVQAALLTGCRYGELIAMRVGDFNPDSGTLAVRKSKSGRARHVVLTSEGQRLFEGLVAGRIARDGLFVRSDGKPWGASHQQRPLEAASARARIEPAATFHILRHTYASTAVMRGISLEVIAEQLGHADTRVTKKHYAHLAPSYVAQAIRAGFGDMGLVGENSVVSISR